MNTLVPEGDPAEICSGREINPDGHNRPIGRDIVPSTERDRPPAQWEVNNAQVINRYDVLMPYLHRQDVLFSDSHKSKTPSTPYNKRPATEATIQVVEVVGGHKKGHKLDNRPLCSFCSKLGHLIDACWLKHPEKKAFL